MDVKTIKGVSENKWRTFKALAAEKNMLMGNLFEVMVDDYSKHADSFWEKILNGEKILSDKEAEDISNISKSLRKERGFRL